VFVLALGYDSRKKGVERMTTKGKGEVAIVHSDGKFRIVIPKRMREIIGFDSKKSIMMVAIDDSVVIKPMANQMHMTKTMEMARKIVDVE
jgi:bifunctional DNA-binding transcriptional regulator/antitoxin component of YhaV-PrlF toxin-antitoxin module